MLKDYYRTRGSSADEADRAVSSIQGLERFLLNSGTVLDGATVSQVSDYVRLLTREQRINREVLVALARYFYLLKSHDVFVFFALMLGSRGVMENIFRRLADSEGEDAAQAILGDYTIPPLGTPLKEMPARTHEIMQRIEAHLSPDKCAKVLSGNNHGVPREMILKEKEHYERSTSLDSFLKEMHDRKVAQLQEHCDANLVWFEQIITQDVVDFVRSNQEILSAVRVNDKLYVTKIPFDIVHFLSETDPQKRRYHACHCPFVKESLLEGKTNVSGNWCYCSAGYEKFPFEVILDTELEIELLESPLLGHDRCRFAIKLPPKVLA